MNKKIFVTNWKLYCDFEQTLKLAKSLLNIKTSHEVIIAPSTPFLYSVVNILIDQPEVNFAAQNCDTVIEGPSTGNISPRDLKEIGVQYCIVGHSEQREKGENDDIIQTKVMTMLPYVTPILCVGETLTSRNIGASKEIVEAQIVVGLREIGSHQKAIIAYEPRWAISKNGVGETANCENIVEMHSFIKKLTDDTYPVLYGGNVTADNCKQIMNLPNVDGVLVGHASTKVEILRALLTS